MAQNKPLIFITNDDGYTSGGIKALIDSVKGLGKIVVVAPDGPRSGMSGAISSTSPLRVTRIHQEDDLEIYSCNGTPVDCVKLGISEIAGRKPDLVVTGINHGSNASICVLYSGTMGAAIEGCIFKIPSIGFSLLDHSYEADFSTAKTIARNISNHVLHNGLPIGTCLNVNIPKGNDIKGVKVCRQTAGQWVDEFFRSKDGSGKEVFWLTGRFQNDEPADQATDEWALAQGYATIVPVKVDMTDHSILQDLKFMEEI